MAPGELTDSSRLNALEQQAATTSTDIRSIYAGIDDIRDVLVRIQENARPNMAGLFIAVLATCTFLVTIGGLVILPINRELSEVQLELREDRQRQDTYFDRELRKSEQLSLERHNNQNATIRDLLFEIRENRVTTLESRERLAHVEGLLQGRDSGK